VSNSVNNSNTIMKYVIMRYTWNVR